MLKSLKAFFKDLTQAEEPPTFTTDDHRLAAAALMVHVVAVDGGITADESARLRTVLRASFDLDAKETADLIAEAERADAEAVDLYAFTSVLKRALDAEGKLKVVEMLWEMVLADGAIHEFEDNVVWRVADLLGVSTRDRVHARQAVEARRAEENRGD